MIPEFLGESGVGGLLSIIGIVGSGGLAAAVAYYAISLAAERSRDGDEDTKRARILMACRGPAALFLAILGLFLAYWFLIEHPHSAFDFANNHDTWALRIWQVIVIAQASYVGAKVIQALLQLYLERVSSQVSKSLYNRLLSQTGWMIPLVIYLLAALMALDVLGVSITPLIAGLGIGGIAIALALQPTLSNLFSGTFMVSEGELNEGDFIELDGGPAGFVVSVTWRSTKIRDRFNNLIIIPNSTMMDSIMTNYYSESKEMSVLVECGISYDSDLERVEEVALEVAGQLRDELEEAIDDFDPVIRFRSFGESNIDFVVVMRAADRTSSFVVKHELMKRLHARLRQEGIEINYPVRKLVMPSSDGLVKLPYDEGLELGEPAEDRGE